MGKFSCSDQFQKADKPLCQFLKSSNHYNRSETFCFGYILRHILEYMFILMKGVSRIGLQIFAELSIANYSLVFFNFSEFDLLTWY